MDFPDSLRYSAEHEWVRVDGDTADEVVIGITDFAQDALGDVVYVALPEIGATLQANGACGEIESTKSVSEVYAPVSGTVIAINAALADTPELVNRDPYGEGWLARLRVGSPDEVDALMDADAYRALVGE